MARIDGIQDENARAPQRLVFRTAAKRLGAIPDPLRIMAHSSGAMWGGSFFQLAFDRARSVDARLKTLACLKAAALIGCVF